MKGVLLFVAVAIWGVMGGEVMDMPSEEIDSSEHGVVKGRVSTNCTCGWANKANKRVIGGTETNVNEYPPTLGLAYRSSKIVVCGGAIITKWHGITATHCTLPMKEKNREMSVVVGEHDLIRGSETTATKFIDVEYSIEHDGYRLLGHPNDIAILVLAEPIEFNQYVGPACLPTGVTDLSKQMVRVTGWGRTNPEGGSSQVLLKADLRVVPTPECNTKVIVKLPVDIPRQFCTYARNRDSCKGDSGGPLYWLDPQTNRYTLVGLVSYGYSCNAGKPGINTNVAYYLDWIQSKIADSNKPDAKTCAKRA